MEERDDVVLLTICKPNPRPTPRSIWYPIHFPLEVSAVNVDNRPFAIETIIEPTIIHGR